MLHELCVCVYFTLKCVIIHNASAPDQLVNNSTFFGKRTTAFFVKIADFINTGACFFSCCKCFQLSRCFIPRDYEFIAMEISFPSILKIGMAFNENVGEFHFSSFTCFSVLHFIFINLTNI